MKYHLHGLILDTPFHCPELLPASGIADIIVHYGQLDQIALEWRVQGVCYKAAPGRFLLSVPGIADYFVEDGKTVTITPAQQVDEDALRLFFYHEVMGALLLQRGNLLLKGFAAERDGKVYAFAGSTPAGKTVLATVLCQQGYRLVSDGFYCLSGGGQPLVQPGLPQLMPWESALNELGIDHKDLKPVRNGMRRYYLPPNLACCEKPLPPACIYILSLFNQDGWSVTTPAGAEKLFSILLHRYHAELEGPLDIMKSQHQLAANLATSTNIKIMHYNDSHTSLRQVIAHIKAELEAPDQ